MELGQNSSSKNRILNAIMWSMASSWSAKLMDFAVILILARLLTPADFGLVSLVMVYLALGIIFVQGGFAQAIIQRNKIKNLHLDTAFWTCVAVGSTLTVFTYVFGPSAFEYVFEERELGSIVKVTSILFTVAALKSVQHAYLTRRLAFKQLAIRQAIATLVGGIVAIVLAFRGFGVWSLVALHMVSSLLGVCLLWIASNWRPSFKFSKTCFCELFSFGIHMVGKELLGFLHSRGISLFIGLFLGPSALGYFVLANKIVQSILELVTTSIQSVAFPAFSRLQNDGQRLRNAFYRAVRFTSLISFPTYFGLSSVAIFVFPLFLGAKWALSIPVLQVLCILGVLESVNRYVHSLILARGKANWVLYIGIVYVVAIYLGFLVAAQWGILAVAISRVAVGYLIAPLVIAAGQLLVGISYRDYFRQISPALLASIAMVAAIIIFRTGLLDETTSSQNLIILVLIGALTYLASIFVIDRSIFRDVRQLLGGL